MKIAWLEQSGLLQERAEWQQQLENAGVAFYRLNWRHAQDDPFANVFPEKDERLSWSKGRERLYLEAKKKDYDYYIFADDDLVLDRPVTEFFAKIDDVLSEYRPRMLMVKGERSWQEIYIPKTSKSPVPIFVVDLQFQCLSRETAEFAFPVKFDGGWGTLWYPMLYCNRKPGNVISIRDMSVKNTAHSADGDYGGVENMNAGSIWERSRPYMSLHAWLLSKLVGHVKTIMYLNWVYSKYLRPRKNVR
ncbi:hypothetical protein [uncultured Cohaesibacter sp.]|uniref:hypothetical protein n=1 Tax=uncultured Cohaesibacter sp. TaxID=1002546 RepID=UPI0029C942B9|nr:hypothetical protein [uncultured Cohaesibacter sp.]